MCRKGSPGLGPRQGAGDLIHTAVEPTCLLTALARVVLLYPDGSIERRGECRTWIGPIGGRRAGALVAPNAESRCAADPEAQLRGNSSDET